MARDALNVAGRFARDGGPRTGQYVDVGHSLGLLTQTVEALDRTLGEIATAVAHETGTGRLIAVDGPFEGDTAEAAEATDLWITKSREIADELRTAVTNAHIAAAGFAQCR